jgi:hypothetical protein
MPLSQGPPSSEAPPSKLVWQWRRSWGLGRWGMAMVQSPQSMAVALAT